MIETTKDALPRRALGPQVMERLEGLVALLRKWNPTINLVAPGTLDDAWQRHVADSVQVFDHLPHDARSWLDLGSGAGFPGLVVAILARDRALGLTVELVEADQRKCVFLQTAARELDLPVVITRARIETLAPRKADVISARALASLDQLLRYAVPHLAPNGICLFLKGTTYESELAHAQRHFRFDLTAFPSQTDPSGRLIKIAALAHV